MKQHEILEYLCLYVCSYERVNLGKEIKLRVFLRTYEKYV